MVQVSIIRLVNVEFYAIGIFDGYHLTEGKSTSRIPEPGPIKQI